MNRKLKLLRFITNNIKLMKLFIMVALLVITATNGVTPTGERDPDDWCGL